MRGTWLSCCVNSLTASQVSRLRWYVPLTWLSPLRTFVRVGLLSFCTAMRGRTGEGQFCGWMRLNRKIMSPARALSLLTWLPPGPCDWVVSGRSGVLSSTHSRKKRLSFNVSYLINMRASRIGVFGKEWVISRLLGCNGTLNSWFGDQFTSHPFTTEISIII